MRLNTIPYRPDSADLFNRIAAEPWAVFLDSGQPRISSGRFDILTARPFLTLQTRGGLTEIEQAGQVSASNEDPFALLRHYLAVESVASKEVNALPFSIPFIGGAIGFFAYDLARRIEFLPARQAGAASADLDMAIGLYDWAVVVDHAQKLSWLVSAERDARTLAMWDELLALFGDLSLQEEQPPAPEPFQVGEVSCSGSFETYRSAFAQVQRFIQAGDCYQVNLAQRFAAPVSGDHWLGYQLLRRLNPAPYAAFLNVPGSCVLSSSPERFLSLRAGQVETKPIKGTCPRTTEAKADAALARALSQSEKDRAENVMIVDLLRNDLGKVCVPGSVAVPHLFAIESFATVHHLVSTVTGQLAAGVDAVGLLRACFPGGSITGAPKLRAMQIIDELEPQRRGVYCGAIGWLGFNGDMDSNIAIRTLVSVNGQLQFWAGGGIVADSQVAAEYRECFDKAEAMLRLLRECGGKFAGGDFVGGDFTEHG